MEKKGFVYKMIFDGFEEFYIGSTVDLVKRISRHKKSIKYQGKDSNSKKVLFLKNNSIELNKNNFIILEEILFTDRKELLKIERFYIEFLKPSLNTSIPLRTLKEYKEQNKDKIKEYNEKNKYRTSKKAKEYREQNKDKIKEYRNGIKRKEYEKNRNKLRTDCEICRKNILKIYHNTHVKKFHKEIMNTSQMVVDHLLDYH